MEHQRREQLEFDNLGTLIQSVGSRRSTEEFWRNNQACNPDRSNPLPQGNTYWTVPVDSSGVNVALSAAGVYEQLKDQLQEQVRYGSVDNTQIMSRELFGNFEGNDEAEPSQSRGRRLINERWLGLTENKGAWREDQVWNADEPQSPQASLGNDCWRVPATKFHLNTSDQFRLQDVHHQLSTANTVKESPWQAQSLIRPPLDTHQYNQLSLGSRNVEFEACPDKEASLRIRNSQMLSGYFSDAAQIPLALESMKRNRSQGQFQGYPYTIADAEVIKDFQGGFQKARTDDNSQKHQFIIQNTPGTSYWYDTELFSTATRLDELERSVRTRVAESPGLDWTPLAPRYQITKPERVLRPTAGKDRHSKVNTAKGLRDRRVRLSVTTAIQFYDIQDRLGYDQPSKAVDWLMKNAKAAIDDLPQPQISRHTTEYKGAAHQLIQPAEEFSVHQSPDRSLMFLETGKNNRTEAISFSHDNSISQALSLGIRSAEGREGAEDTSTAVGATKLGMERSKSSAEGRSGRVGDVSCACAAPAMESIATAGRGAAAATGETIITGDDQQLVPGFCTSRTNSVPW